MRIVGVFAMLLTAAAALVQRPTRRTLMLLVVYGVIVGALLPVVWPVLRIDFARIVRDAVLGSTSNPYLGADLFRGRMISASELPRDYVPTWILITTPLVVLGLFVVGASRAIASLVRSASEWRTYERQRDLIVLGWFFLPVLGCVVLRPILYDGWRHLYFIYPALVYLAAVGMETIDAYAAVYAGEFRRRTVDLALSAALLLCLAPVVAFMAQNHPFEHLYFNRFAGGDMKEVKRRFELDYWGLSYRKALEYIVRTDAGKTIRIFTTTYPGRLNVAMLPGRDRARVEIVDTDAEADYVMTNYRFHPQDYPYAREVFSVRVGNASIASVFDVRSQLAADSTRVPLAAAVAPR
jgi:hypothetical protein